MECGWTVEMKAKGPCRIRYVHSYCLSTLVCLKMSPTKKPWQLLCLNFLVLPISYSQGWNCTRRTNMVGVNYFTHFVSKTITTMFRWNPIRIFWFYYKSWKSSYGSSFRTKHNLIFLCAINPFLNTVYYFLFPCKLGYSL